MKVIILNDKATGKPVTWTPEYIRERIENSSAAAIAGMLCIFEYQTSTEKAIESTTVVNFAGFNSADAELLSSFSKQWNDKKYLTAKQIKLCQEKMPKYSKQIFNHMCAKYPNDVQDVPKPKKVKLNLLFAA